MEPIEDIMNRQIQANEPDEPEVLRTDGSHYDSGSIVDSSNRNGDVDDDNDNEG